MLRALRRSFEQLGLLSSVRRRLLVAWHRPPRAVLVGVGVAIALLVSLLFSFGPLVRARIALEAERRDLDVEVAGVRPGFFAVRLHGVRVRPRGVSGLEARIDELEVDLGATLGVRGVRARGGGLFVEGEPEEVMDRLRQLRRSGDDDRASTRTSSKRSLSAEGLSITWNVPSGGQLIGSGVRASRTEAGLELRCARCSATHRHVTIEVTDADVALAPDGAPRHIGASALSVTYAPPRTAAGARAAPPTAVDPAPPPLPMLQKRGVQAAKATASITPPAPKEPVLPLPDLHALRARLATALAAFAARVPDGGMIEIGGLSAKLDVGGELVALGPGAFTSTRRGDRVHVGFASSGAEGSAPGSTPLSVDADLPITSGEMVARLAGGPVSLAALGVAEGTKGLTDVARGTLEGKGQLVLSPAADALTFDGHVALRSIAMKQPRFSPEPLRGLDFSVSGRGVLDDAGRLRVDDAQLDMGALHVRTHGTVEESSDHFAVSLAIDVAPAACQALLDSAPEGLLPTVRAARMAGTFGANVNLAFDTRTIDKLSLDYRVDDQCKMVEVPRDLSRDRFGDAFTYRTYKPDGTIGETTTGPGTSAWTNLEDIRPFMVAAVLTTEDGAFYKHKGYNHAAIRSSVQANLKARRFVRGASTISMQLAKNLFLSREKALSRKIEEVILTDYLEQVFRKDELMELYLNVVEFGPDVYGITAAAEYYFGRKPDELNLAECFFLATLLPSPIRYGKLRDKGEASEAWTRHLHTLMEIAERNGKITTAELEEGLKEPVVFVRPGDERPEPRRPVTSRRRDPSDDDSVWRPLD